MDNETRLVILGGFLLAFIFLGVGYYIGENRIWTGVGALIAVVYINIIFFEMARIAKQADEQINMEMQNENKIYG